MSSVITGFLVARRVEREWELENIVVAEKARRQGIGLCLAKEFVDHVKRTCGAAIFLEVRESNHAARALYGKLGFQESARREHYYSNPAEDAILYSITL